MGKMHRPVHSVARVVPAAAAAVVGIPALAARDTLAAVVMKR